MSVEIKTDKAAWKAIVGKAAETAAYALAEQILQDSEKYVPFSGGSYQSAGFLREGRIDPPKGGGSELYLVYDAVYALYQWFGMRDDGTHKVRHYTTPGTGTQWVEKARAVYGKRWQSQAQSDFSRELK